MNQGLEQQTKIRSFTQLNAWQKGHQLVLQIYRLTKEFPKEELYALGDQMRRCSISITSNLAEGFSRYSYKEKVQFYHMALGSNTELQNQLLVCRDVGYLNKDKFTLLANLSIEVNKMINGLIKSSKTRSHNS